MPRCIVKQPNGLYAIWSTIVDDFIIYDATAEDAIWESLEDIHMQNYPGGRDALRRDICREFENIKQTGRAWKWAPNFEESIITVRELHGKALADEREKEMRATAAPTAASEEQ